MYRGIDSLTPAPTLPATFSNLLVGASSGTITADPEDDASYTFNFAGFGSGGFYGLAVTSFNVHSNGLITFNGNDSFFENRAFPDSRFSGRYIAPFFDDLVPVDGVSSITWEATTASFVVVQWNDFARYDDPNARLTFRVTMQLGSGDGTIAFQYISMTGTGADGSSATIGVHEYTDEDQYWVQYSHNQAGVIPTGTATAGTALLTVLIGRDVDGDGLIAALETNLGTSDGSFDSDTGGVGDGAEFVAGTDPTASGDDVNTDTDSDGLSDVDEAFFGTNPAVADTDGDGIDDFDELDDTNTDPTLADTDGDGANDLLEDDENTDPRDFRDFPYPNIADSGDSKEKGVAVADAAGNIHAIIRDNNDYNWYYYMLSPTGEKLISETTFKVSQELYSRRHSIHFYDGLLYVGYEIIRPVQDSEDEAELWLMVLNPALDDQDGDAASAAAITVSNTEIPVTGGWPRHHDKEVGPTGIHWVWTNYAGTPWPEDSGTTETAYYARTSLTGALEFQKVLHIFDTQSFDADNDDFPNTYGIHKILSPRVALDEAGTAQIVFMAQRAPYYQGSEEGGWPSGLWYASASGNTVLGPYRVGNGQGERTDIAMLGSLAYIGISNGYDTDRDDYAFIGVRMAIFDTQNYSIIPRPGDFFGIEWALDNQSMVFPLQTVYANDIEFQGMTVAVRDDGVAFLQVSDDTNEMCILAVASNGKLLGRAPCYFSGDADETWRREPLIIQDGYIATVFNDEDSNFYFARIPVRNLIDDTGSIPALNLPPVITTSAPARTLGHGQTFTYAPAATDPEGGTLTWSLGGAPNGMSIDAATGVVTWETTRDDLGGVSPVVTVCDDGAPVRCDTEVLNLIVTDGDAPVITSNPSITALFGRAWSYQVVAVDPQDDVETFELVTRPEGMEIDNNGLVSWTPNELGSFAVVVVATDSQGLTGRQSFTVTVTGGDGISVDGSGGCNTGGTSGAFGVLVLGLLALLRRRRWA